MTIAHAAERTYTRGSVAFGPFLGVPKIENYINANPKASQGSRFFRGRVQKYKFKITRLSIDGPKMAHLFAIELYLHFSGNPQNVTLNYIFRMSKTLEKVVKITRFDVLREPFINLDQGSRRMRKITQNDAKMHLKSPQN